MSSDLRHDRGREQGAEAPRLSASLPESLSGLVSEDVWAQSNERVEEKLRSRSSREAYKRLYIEALAEHLLEEVEHEHEGTLEDASEGLPRRAA